MTLVQVRPLIVAAGLVAAVACTKSDRTMVDSAGGSVTSAVGTALSVIDIDMGKHADSTKSITDKTDDFAPKDTIFASVHTSGTAQNGEVLARWTYQDGTMISQMADTVSTDGDARSAFFLAKPEGFAPGTYTIHIMIDGKEVRTKDVTVK